MLCLKRTGTARGCERKKEEYCALSAKNKGIGRRTIRLKLLARSVRK